MERAFFVKYPRRIDEIRQPHLQRDELPYQVVKTITLSQIDYENFITDMIADRLFLEENVDVCSSKAPFQCLLVQQRGSTDGVLVVPVGKGYVGYAAYYCE